MSDPTLRVLVERLLAAQEIDDLDAQDALRHPDFVEEYPQSRERIRGRDRVRQMLETHPSPPRGMRSRLTELANDFVLAEVAAEYNGEPWWIAGFFSGAGGQLTSERTYFGPAYPAPDWRAPWVERITADDWLQDAGGHGEVTRETAQRLVDLSMDYDAIGPMRHPDWYGDMPQTGERFRGHANYAAAHRNFPGGMPQGEGQLRGPEDEWVVAPTFAPTRVAGHGAHWAAEGWLTYPNGDRYLSVMIAEFRDGLSVAERWYYFPPFDPPAWRDGISERY